MKSQSKKARSDAGMKGKSLTDPQKAEVAAWLTVENVSYADARTRMAERFGVFVKSDSTVSDFYHSFALPWKYAQASNFAAGMSSLKRGEFKPAILNRLEQLAFEVAASNTVDVKTLKSFLKMLTDSEKVELMKGNLQLGIQKFREQVKADVEKGLDALHAVLKGNPEALALFEKLKALVLKSVEAAKS